MSVDLSKGVFFRAAVSGLWYEKREAAGDVSAVLVDGALFLAREGDQALRAYDKGILVERRATIAHLVQEREALKREREKHLEAAPGVHTNYDLAVATLTRLIREFEACPKPESESDT